MESVLLKCFLGATSSPWSAVAPTRNSHQTKSCSGTITNKRRLENFHSKIKLWLSSFAKISKKTLIYNSSRVVVVLEGRVYVYNFADLRLIDAIDTCNNPKGLCALNSDGKNAVLVTPANQKGYVRVAHYD